MYDLMGIVPAGEHALYLKNQMILIALRTLARKRGRRAPVHT
jgi:hypothetical protein